jgi:dolichyl-phosphate beta-glucosyltransferase
MILSIVIPAFNESERLPATLKTISAYLDQQRLDAEILVVDDGSTDRTGEIAKEILPTVRVLRHTVNQGKGAAVRTGMLAAHGEWWYLCDADLSTPISELRKFLDARSEKTVIIGSRRVPGSHIVQHQALWKEYLGRLGNWMIQVLLLPGIHDSQCGFKLFPSSARPVFEQQRQQRWGYDFEVLYLARKMRLKIVELPVAWVNDDRSKVQPFDYFKTLGELLSIRANAWMGKYKMS